jgi:hypothetical protein
MGPGAVFLPCELAGSIDQVHQCISAELPAWLVAGTASTNGSVRFFWQWKQLRLLTVDLMYRNSIVWLLQQHCHSQWNNGCILLSHWPLVD